MTDENNPDQRDPSAANAASAGGLNKVTTFGEPLWKDALKTIWAATLFFLFIIVVGGALSVAIIAPWGRASHDCSIYCVIRKHFGITGFDDKPSG